MDLETMRLALGAFLTSPGFGGLMAGAGVLVALRKAGDDRRTAEEARHEARLLQEQNEERDRWWRMFTWLDDNADAVDIDTYLALWEVLDESAPSQPLAAMLQALDGRLKLDWATREAASEEHNGAVDEGGAPDAPTQWTPADE